MTHARGKKRHYSEYAEQKASSHHINDAPMFQNGTQGKFGSQSRGATGNTGTSSAYHESSTSNRTRTTHASLDTRQVYTKQRTSAKNLPRRPPPQQRHAGQRRSGKAVDRGSQSASSPSGNPESIMDEAHIRKSVEVPRQNQYPEASHTLFGPHVLQGLHDLAAGLQGAHFNLSSASSTSRGVFRCIASLNTDQYALTETIGEGTTKKAAARAACLHLLGILHRDGVLQKVFATEEKVDSATIRQESGSKEEIYGYAARFALTPHFDYRIVPRPGRAKNRDQFEVRITLPEQGIDVVAMGSDINVAEITAALRFKQSADLYQSEHGHGKITVRDRSVLNMNNVKNFFEFYRTQPSHQSISVKSWQFERFTAKQVGLGGLPWEAQAMIDDKPLGPSAIMTSKKRSEALAWLVGATTLMQQQPELKDEFKEALSKVSGSGEILAPVKPIDVHIDSDAVLIMRETLRDVRTAGLEDEKTAVEAEDGFESTKRQYTRKILTKQEIMDKNESLRKHQLRLNEDASLIDVRKKRADLPMSHRRQEVTNMVNEHTYSIIIGSTGSGKTTQVPQILLEDAIKEGRGVSCNVICTQPRRIAATSVAQRVAEERGEQLRSTVGYSVRFDSKRPQEGGSITYCTTGILLQQLQTSPDDTLDRLSHIVIDEVHERDIIIDFLMIVIKRSLASRRAAGKSVPKVVLMSATINPELFATYFRNIGDDGAIVDCPSLSVPGRTFPVKERYLEDFQKDMEDAHGHTLTRFLERDPATRDYLLADANFKPPDKANQAPLAGDMHAAPIDWKGEKSLAREDQTGGQKTDSLVPIHLVAATIAHVCRVTDEGAILVFLPGYDEMKKTREALQNEGPLDINFNNDTNFKISMLHSSVPAAEQQEVFETLPQGCRRIILSTNIAETSVTIPEVQHIVDSGKLREKRYDQTRRITSLQCTWISKSNAKQRAGRAGRVRNGNYYALYSRERFSSLRPTGLPEMLRSDLQEICLDIKTQPMTADIQDFLSQAIEPPNSSAIEASIRNLQVLEALTADEQLTPLGRLLAALPVHPSLGKMIVMGIIFRCLDPLVILGATHAGRNLFVQPPEKRQEARALHQQFLEKTGSDHFAILNAYSQLRDIELNEGFRAMRRYAVANFLHVGAYATIKSTTLQIEEILVDAGLIPHKLNSERFGGEIGPSSLNRNSDNVALIKTLVVGGVYPNLAVCQGFLFRTLDERRAMLHPSSLQRVERSFKRSVGDASKQDDNNAIRYGSLIAYSTMAKGVTGDNTYLKDTSLVTPLMALLFGGRLRAGNEDQRVLTMDGWLPFKIRLNVLSIRIIAEFRKALDRVLTRSFEDLEDFRKSRAAARRVNARNPQVPSHHPALQASLADDEVRDTFARGVVDVIDRDLYKPAPRYSKARPNEPDHAMLDPF
ncbi:MAG: hypothetical protein M1828_001663 [Chrysothrix sp. TS-e1954]|nr:MAG: hypothetical protein M1828_001663 [Chrysothrix sp. TS-e1954]